MCRHALWVLPDVYLQQQNNLKSNHWWMVIITYQKQNWPCRSPLLTCINIQGRSISTVSCEWWQNFSVWALSVLTKSVPLCFKIKPSNGHHASVSLIMLLVNHGTTQELITDSLQSPWTWVRTSKHALYREQSYGKVMLTRSFAISVISYV